MTIWRSFKGPAYHVLGNHDTDGGFTRDQTVAWSPNVDLSCRTVQEQAYFDAR